MFKDLHKPCTKKTTATGMQKSKKSYTIQQIASVTGHHNYQSLESYLEEPDEEDHVDFCDSLFNYTGANDENNEESSDDANNFDPPPPPKNKLKLKKKQKPTSTITSPPSDMSNKENVKTKPALTSTENSENTPMNQIIPCFPPEEDINMGSTSTQSGQIEVSDKSGKQMVHTNMTMSKIPNIFGNSTFTNCTINFHMPQ